MPVEIKGIRQGDRVALNIAHPAGSIINVTQEALSDLIEKLKDKACANCAEAFVRCPLPGGISPSVEILTAGTNLLITNPNCLIPGKIIYVSEGITIDTNPA